LTPADVAAAGPVRADELLELKAGSMVGEYRIDGPLGEGGMATVYAATHPLIGKRAAIKVMTPQLSADTAAVERFVQEARAVNQIGHPNIIDVFAFGTLPDGRSYFVMELLPGQTLHSRIDKEPLKLRESIAILFDVCDALEAAHEKGIVHRDLKPENIFLVNLRNNRRQVKLLDFGVAKLNNNADARLQRTRQDTIIGTPHYLSPEQARAKPVDAKTDVYSLGVMAFEMIVGQVPFNGDNVMDILVQHMNAPPPLPSSLRPGIPAEIDDILVRMLAKEPGKRPSLDEIRAALGGARDALSTERDGFIGPMEDSGPRQIAPVARATPPRTTPPVGAGEPAAESSAMPSGTIDESSTLGRSSRWPIFVVGSVLALGVGGVLFFTTQGTPAPRKDPPPPPIAATKPAQEPAAPTAATPAPATLRITVDAPDATIEVDESVVAEHAGNATVTLGLIGSHVVKASAPGRKAVTKVLNVVAGETLDLPLVLPKIASARPKPAKKSGDYMIDPFGKH
jgi:serine/threonine-protein kinase